MAKRSGKQMSAWLPPELIDEFKALADRKDRTNTKELERAMRFWLACDGEPPPLPAPDATTEAKRKHD